MNSRKVTVVDYGIGNVYSVCQAIRQLGGEPQLTSQREKILAADYLILPGVGSFSKGMDLLIERGLAEVIKEFCARERPFLGICLGMQMLMTRSYEMGTFEGLDLIPGSVEPIPQTDAAGNPHKVPHIAWAPLFLPDGAPEDHWDGSLLAGITPGKQTFYFVHSYMACPEKPENVLADSRYDGRPFTAAVRKDNIMGTQFHPERSGPAGLRLLQNFMEM